MNLPHLEALAEEPVVTCTYNTSKYNVAIFNGKELSVMATCFFGFGLINWTIESLQLDAYTWMIFREFFITVCKVFINLYYVIMKKVVRDFICHEILPMLKRN